MYQRCFKRVIDVICALLALIVFCWLYAIIAILVRIKLGSPVIFKQDRPGKDEKIFTLYKFRTMTDDRDNDGNLLPDEVRLTHFGKWLRSTSLDEIPEAANILKGDMSVVGPRALLVEYLPYYTEVERQRHSVRPGLTGLAQINGRTACSWEEKFGADIQYLKKISLREDFRIIFATLVKAIRRDDVVMGEQHVYCRLDDYRITGDDQKKTHRVSIRKFEMSDIQNKLDWINNPENNQFLHYDLPMEYDKTLDWYNRTRESSNRFDGVIVADGAPAGLIGLLNIDRQKCDAELYICLRGQDFRGKKVALHAVKLLLEKARSEYILKRVYCYTETRNLRACKFFEKCGFRLVKTIEGHIEYNDIKIDRHMYSYDLVE